MSKQRIWVVIAADWDTTVVAAYTTESQAEQLKAELQEDRKDDDDPPEYLVREAILKT